MSNELLVAVRADGARLRAIIASVDRELWLLPRSDIDGQTAAIERMRSSWDELVALLALGPEPEVRECPSCGHFGMLAATRCGYCWNKLLPLPASANGGPRASASQ